MNINDKIADLERQLAELKAEAAKPVVEYREAEWPRDWSREDAQFRDECDEWEDGLLVGHDPNDRNASWGSGYGGWYQLCRVPIRDTYRTPSLPADAGKVCEFSNDGEQWEEAKLDAWSVGYWLCGAGCFKHCRIKD